MGQEPEKILIDKRVLNKIGLCAGSLNQLPAKSPLHIGSKFDSEPDFTHGFLHIINSQFS
jgi:hypothetical protein